MKTIIKTYKVKKKRAKLQSKGIRSCKKILQRLSGQENRLGIFAKKLPFGS